MKEEEFDLILMIIPFELHIYLSRRGMYIWFDEGRNYIEGIPEGRADLGFGLGLGLGAEHIAVTLLCYFILEIPGGDYYQFTHILFEFKIYSYFIVHSS